MVMRSESALVSYVPGTTPTFPAGSKFPTCIATATSGRGKRFSKPSLIMLSAPPMVSSAGCPISSRVPCQVQVVPASVHDGDIFSCVILGTDLTGVREPGFFFHWKGIEFRAKHDRRPGAGFEDGNDAGAADVFRHLVAKTAQPARQLRCRLGLVRRQFRVLV